MEISNEILEIIGKLLGAAAVALGTYLAKQVKEYLDERKLGMLIEGFVKGAEQTLYKDDPDGSTRKKYVCDALEALGYAITEKVAAQIEGAVWEVNNRNKVAKNGNS